MHACRYDACIYDAANFVTDERMDEQGDSRSWILFACKVLTLEEWNVVIDFYNYIHPLLIEWCLDKFHEILNISYLIVSTQPPDDSFALRLISRDVLQPQATASRCRRRSMASAIIAKVFPLLPPPSCRGLYVQGASPAIIVWEVAGDVGDVFVCGEFQSFFLGCPLKLRRACVAPSAPTNAVSEEESRFLIELFSTWRGSRKSSHSDPSWRRSQLVSSYLQSNPGQSNFSLQRWWEPLAVRMLDT